MKGHAPISSIYRHGQQSQTDPEAAFSREWSLKRRLYSERGLIVVEPSQLPEDLSEAVKAWADMEYGGQPSEL